VVRKPRLVAPRRSNASNTTFSDGPSEFYKWIKSHKDQKNERTKHTKTQDDEALNPFAVTSSSISKERSDTFTSAHTECARNYASER
jgi:hypothetical protein